MRDEDRLAFSIDESAIRAGVCRDKIYDAINAGRLRARKNGRRTLILASDLEAYLNDLPLLAPKSSASC